MKWSFASIASSLCGTMRWCSSAASLRHQEVALAVHDQERRLEPLEQRSQPALVGVEEVTRVLSTQRKTVERSEMRESQLASAFTRIPAGAREPSG